MAWLDTQSTRDPSTQAYALLNDNDAKVTDSIKSALSNYTIKPILWSLRDSVIDELAG